MPYVANTALTFAQRQINRYKNGECWTLVEDAIVGAGAKSSIGLTPKFGKNVSYIWGTPVNIVSLRPGDVLQFQSYVWRKTTRIDVSSAEGSKFSEDFFDQVRGKAHHSALVVRVVSAGIVEVIEQNIPPVTGKVQTVELILIPPAPTMDTQFTRDSEGKVIATTITKVTHEVSGDINCFRPMDTDPPPP
jgi:hypothetical protein